MLTERVRACRVCSVRHSVDTPCSPCKPLTPPTTNYPKPQTLNIVFVSNHVRKGLRETWSLKICRRRSIPTCPSVVFRFPDLTIRSLGLRVSGLGPFRVLRGVSRRCVSAPLLSQAYWRAPSQYCRKCGLGKDKATATYGSLEASSIACLHTPDPKP